MYVVRRLYNATGETKIIGPFTDPDHAAAEGGDVLELKFPHDTFRGLINMTVDDADFDSIMYDINDGHFQWTKTYKLDDQVPEHLMSQVEQFVAERFSK